MVFPTPDVVAFIRRLSHGAKWDGHEKRKHRRHDVSVPIHVTPCDEQNEPAGESFRAVSRNLSSSGIAFVYQRPITAKRLLVRLITRQQQMQLVMNVVRCQAIGMFYEIAGEFVDKVDEGPVSRPDTIDPAE